MACNATDIPTLSFPRNEIIEIIPASYNNEAKRILIPDLPYDMIPGSPENIAIPVPPSGTMTPMSGIGTPARGASFTGVGSRLSDKAAESGTGTASLVDRALRRN